MDNGQKIPVICLAQSSAAAFRLFNPNDWSGESKAIIQSCSTELSVLHFECSNIKKLCVNPDQRCLSHFENLKRCCKEPNDILHKTVCYAQIPEIYVFIKAFFASLKGLLDLVVQLLNSEEIVNAKLDGFHRKKDVYGGSVLNALSKNVLSGKEPIAQKIIKLIETHNSNWINEAIRTRDWLVHPTKGIHQLMFKMILGSHDDSLIFKRAVPPSVGNQSIDNYARTQVGNIEEFCKSFIGILLDNRVAT